MEILPHPQNETVTQLLTEAGLPTEDIAPERGDFFGAWSEGKLAGVIGLELYGDSALLRSLAVKRSFRGQGLGLALVARAEQYALARGVKRIYLLTTTAERFFSLLGYSLLDKRMAPAAIRATTEFSRVCPGAAKFMAKSIRAK